MSRVWNGNQIRNWILLQEDLFIEEQQCFHIGELHKRFFEVFANDPDYQINQLDTIQRDQLLRAISMEAHLAKHLFTECRAKPHARH